MSALEARGYRVRVGAHATDNAGPDAPYLAGADDDRASDLNDALRDREIDLVLCARGGYGAMRILDRLDYDAARRDPKPLVGYSDVTALSLALAARAGVVSFSGIMATAGHGFGEDTLDPNSETSFWAAVAGSPQERILQGPGSDAPSWSVLRPPLGGGETVSGPVIPVCLSLLTSLLGSPYVPDLAGAILVIEDVHEEPYAVDRCLTQLRLTGVLDNLAAVLIGSFNGFEDDENENLARVVPQLVLNAAPPHIAVVSGVLYGHIPRRLTLPVGALGNVNLTTGAFTFNRQ